VSGSANVWLGVIAAATLLIAVAQIGVLVIAGILARRLAQLSHTLEHQAKPIVGHLDAIGREAAKAAALATNQVERADRLFADVTGRVEKGLTSLQAAVAVPAREGAALLSGIRAAVAVFRNPPPALPRHRPRADDEDPLFI
jgi:hypothetical protein